MACSLVFNVLRLNGGITEIFKGDIVDRTLLLRKECVIGQLVAIYNFKLSILNILCNVLFLCVLDPFFSSILC